MESARWRTWRERVAVIEGFVCTEKYTSAPWSDKILIKSIRREPRRGVQRGLFCPLLVNGRPEIILLGTCVTMAEWQDEEEEATWEEEGETGQKSRSIISWILDVRGTKKFHYSRSWEIIRIKWQDRTRAPEPMLSVNFAECPLFLR